MTSPERVMQTMKFSFIVSGFLLIFVMVKVPVKSSRIADHSMELIIALLAMTNLLLGLYGRPFFGRLVKGRPQGTSKQTQVQQWFTVNICSLACIDACMLFGVVLHFFRARNLLVEFVFGIAMISLIFWSPGTPPAAENGQASIG